MSDLFWGSVSMLVFGIRDFAPLFGVRDAVSANGLLFGPD
jgi:hypothetical protein